MSTTRYGGGELYGTIGLTYGESANIDPTKKLQIAFEVDWDNDGYYDGGNEAGKIYAVETSNGRINFLKGTGDGFEHIAVGKITLQMRNHTGRYNPYNTSSPLYGNLLPGRRFQFRIWDEVNEVYYPIMKGRIDDIRPSYGEIDLVTITMSNGVRQMQKGVKTEVQSNIRYDDALTLLLADFEDGSSIDTTVSETMPYWWASGESLFNEINDIVDAAMGMFNIAEDGLATYRSRVSSDSPLVELSGEDIEKEYGIRSPSIWDAVKNRIRVYARARTTQTNVEIGRISETLPLNAGQSKTIWIQFSFSGNEGVALSVTDPVATTDYTMFANSDGTGTNLTGNLSISITKFATSAKLILLNTGGTNGFINLLKLRGNVIVADNYTYVEEEDLSSIEEYGEYEFNIQTDWLQDINTAQDEADILISRLATARQFPRVMVNPNPEKQFNLRIFALASLNVISKGISGEFRVGFIRHRSMDETLQTWQTEVFFEPNLLGNTSGTWVFPAIFGSTTVF